MSFMVTRTNIPKKNRLRSKLLYVFEIEVCNLLLSLMQLRLLPRMRTTYTYHPSIALSEIAGLLFTALCLEGQ